MKIIKNIFKVHKFLSINNDLELLNKFYNCISSDKFTGKNWFYIYLLDLYFFYIHMNENDKRKPHYEKKIISEIDLNKFNDLVELIEDKYPDKFKGIIEKEIAESYDDDIQDIEIGD